LQQSDTGSRSTGMTCARRRMIWSPAAPHLRDKERGLVCALDAVQTLVVGTNQLQNLGIQQLRVEIIAGNVTYPAINQPAVRLWTQVPMKLPLGEPGMAFAFMDIAKQGAEIAATANSGESCLSHRSSVGTVGDT